MLKPQIIDINFTLLKYKNFMTLKFFDDIIDFQETIISENCKKIKVSIDNSKSDFFQFSVDGKKDDDTLVIDGQIQKDTKISIDKMCVDGIPLDLVFIKNMTTFAPIFQPNQKDYFENNNVELTLDTISYNGLWTMISSKQFWKKYNENEIDNLSAMGEYSLISHVGRVDKKNLDKWYEMLQEITEWQKF